ncbi:MAG: hypothetical protein Q7K54_02320, partial [Candidatus Parcubacteria bacterium]|nr:hypothetical protein [Candidatus Parcubacteria bacterium]
MTEKKSKQIKSIVLEDSPIERGYLPLQILSDQYGYAKDYLGWLSRTGRIEAVRHGKYGQWYALEESLKKYQLSLIPGSKPEISHKMSPLPAEKTSGSIGHESETATVPPVLLLPSQVNPSIAEDAIVLFKNDGSYSADSGVSLQRAGDPNEVWD